MKGGGEENTVAGWLVVLFEQLHLSCTHCAKCLRYIRNVRSEPLEEDDVVSTGITSIARTWGCLRDLDHEARGRKAPEC